MFIDMGLAKAVGLGLVVVGGIAFAIKSAKQKKITWHAADMLALVVIGLGALMLLGLVKTDSATTATDQLRTNMRENAITDQSKSLPPLKEGVVETFDNKLKRLKSEGQEELDHRRQLITP